MPFIIIHFSVLRRPRGSCAQRGEKEIISLFRFALQINVGD